VPIKPENKARYPKDWPAISRRIRIDRAQGQCECTGQCGRDHSGRCPNLNGGLSVVTGAVVVLTVAHLDHTPEHCEDDNLLALCQGCHLAYDREHHAQTAYRTRREGLAASDLFSGPGYMGNINGPGCDPDVP
jgi:hypothetical protein